MDCCLWALRGVRAQFQKCVYNSTFLILSWFLCQTFGGVFKFDCCLWQNAQLLKCVNNSTFLILSWFLCQTVGGVIELDCCSWVLRGGIAQILKCLYTSTFLILSWFSAKNLGEYSSWIVVCEPCGREGTIFKMYVQFNIPDFILIFFQTFGRVIKLDCYLWALLSPEGGRAQFLKCVYNSKFLILSWFLCQTFEGVIKFPLGHWILLGHWFPVRHHDF